MTSRPGRPSDQRPSSAKRPVIVGKPRSLEPPGVRAFAKSFVAAIQRAYRSQGQS
jgi:hypothetical protein